MTFPASHPALARALAARAYTEPTPVQLAVLEADATGRDLLVSAQTGSGKTVAFGLAFAATLLGDAERFDRAGDPLALIIAPTRELALQVQRELAWLYAETGARVVTCVGGMDARAEARQLGFGAHIVVGTPGRLRDHLERGRLVLTGLKTAVLDEADEMLDLGFREDLEFILDATPAERQTLLFSATMPREIETLATRYQREAKRIQTIRRDEAHADIEYSAIRTTPHGIEHAVVNVLRLHEVRAALVFCATREAVKRMHARLVERGFAAVALSGELTQAERTHALQAVRDGRARVLVATDVAARGLDLPDLALVIHADLPNDRETLLHRSGRTGRAGRKGLCVLIVPFNRRRKAEGLVGAARVKVTWGVAPTAEAIRARDGERFLANELFTETPGEEELALARALQEQKSADEITLALIRLHRAQLPAPEDVPEDGGPARRERPERGERAVRSERPSRHGDRDDARERFDKGERRAPREGAKPMVWFRLNIGRERNADPRWLLPLICRAGGITKAEIGAIKIHDRDTRFEVVAEYADSFAQAIKANPSKEGHISRVAAFAAASDAPVHASADVATPQSDAPASVPSASRTTPRDAAPARDFKHGDRKPWRDKERPARELGTERTTPEAFPARREGKKPHRKGGHFSGPKRDGSNFTAASGDGARPAAAKPFHKVKPFNSGPSKYAKKKKRKEDTRG